MSTSSAFNRHLRPAGIATLALLALTLTLPAGADAQVYKSVDAQGNVIFSDNPVEGAVSVERIPLRPANNGPELTPNQRIEQMAATTARLREDRQARESARREAREARTPPASQGYQPVPATHGQTYVPRHFPHRQYGVKPPYRHGNKHRGREHREQHRATPQPRQGFQILPPGVERNPPQTGHRSHRGPHRGGQGEESSRASFNIK